MSHRTRPPLRWAGLVVLSVCSLLLFGQDNQRSQTGKNRTATTPLQINVTGCLKTSASGGFSVTDQNGRTWRLTSKKVDLAEHVFHTVSVSGHPSTGSSKTQEGKSEQNQNTEAGGSQYFGLAVTELTMVSPSCTR
jgi:hypothetical protein